MPLRQDTRQYNSTEKVNVFIPGGFLSNKYVRYAKTKH